jgi:hypothetical protein
MTETNTATAVSVKPLSVDEILEDVLRAESECLEALRELVEKGFGS